MRRYDPKTFRVKRFPQRRKAAVLIEFAIVLPVIILLLMGALEMGRAVMVRHVLEETARAGCRVVVFENGTKQDVLDIVDSAMTAAGMKDYTVTIDPDPPENLEQFEPVTVSVSVFFADVSWIPSPYFMAKKSLMGLCVMPAEGDGANDPDSEQQPSTKKNKKNKKNKK